MDPRQFVIGLFRPGPFPARLRLEEPLPTYRAILSEDGRLVCGGVTVPALRDIDRLCAGMLGAGLPEGAIQVRTIDGDPVCFSASISELAKRFTSAGAGDPQLALAFGPT